MLLACTPHAALGDRPTPKLARLEGHHDVGRELIHPRPDLLQVKQLRQGAGEGLQSWEEGRLALVSSRMARRNGTQGRGLRCWTSVCTRYSLPHNSSQPLPAGGAGREEPPTSGSLSITPSRTCLARSSTDICPSPPASRGCSRRGDGCNFRHEPQHAMPARAPPELSRSPPPQPTANHDAPNPTHPPFTHLHEQQAAAEGLRLAQLEPDLGVGV